MQDGSQLFNQALAVVRDGLGLRQGEELLILWDGTVSQELVSAARYAAHAVGAHPLLLTFRPAVHRPMREFGLFAGASLLDPPPSLPRGVLGAMAGSDRILFATSDMSVSFNPEVRKILRERTAARLSYLTAEAALRLLPDSAEDAQALSALTQRVGQIVASARRAHVTSAAGTDLTLSLGQYPDLNVYDGMVKQGQSQTLPGGQVSCVPNDGSAEGVVVIDRSIGADDFKEITEPVRMTVERGSVTSVSGGVEAERLRRFLERMNDPNIYHLTELGVGTNRRCRFTGVAAPCEDTHTLGCVSLALGCDTHLGGSVRAGAHVDMTMRLPSLELDGKLLVERGKLLID